MAIKDGSDADKLKDLYDKYVAEDMPHLEHEEKIMMPRVSWSETTDKLLLTNKDACHDCWLVWHR